MTERRSPAGVVELLRLFVVVFFAGIGFEIARSLSDTDSNLLGPFNGTAVGVIIGSGLGYVLGGVVGRTTVTVADRTETSLREVPVEGLIASAIGGVIGVLVAAGISWPLFFIPEPYVSFSLFSFVLVVVGYLGTRVGRARREGVLALFGARAGLAERLQPGSLVPRLVDSSVAIDGRILDVVRAGFLHGTMLVCRPVLDELQGLADAADDLKRSRGRRGLEMLEAVKREPGVTVEVIEDSVPSVPEVDGKLVRICLDRDAALLTLDSNLAKAASLAGVQVLNLHALTLALRPGVAAGDDVAVLLIKPGKEAGQAVGYLDDGTMVVAENSRDKIGKEVPVHVTSVLTTSNGRMVFGQTVERRKKPR